MQMTINVPDTLPQERIKQRIQELEQILMNDVRIFSSFNKVNSSVKLSVLKAEKRNHVILGTLKNAFQIPENFDDSLPDEFYNEFYKPEL